MISAFAFAGSAAPAWVPTDLGSGLKLYLPPDAGAITVATGVSQWDDDSGNNYHFTQGTGGAQPYYNNVGGPNSTIAVVFDGTDDYLERAASFSNILSLSAYTMVCVARLDAQPAVGSDNADAAAYDNDAIITNAGGHWYTALRRTNNRVQGGHFDSASKIAGVDVSLSTWYRVRVKYDGADITTKVGSIALATTAASNINGAAAGTALQIGANYNFGDYAAIALSTMLVLNRATTGGEDTDIDAWVTSTFGAGLV
jgi:hypothetical protein